MNLTYNELQILAVALDFRIQSLYAKRTPEATNLAELNKTVLSRVESQMKATALPHIPTLNRDAEGVIWA